MLVVIRTALVRHAVAYLSVPEFLLDHFLEDRLAVRKQLFMLHVIQDESPDECAGAVYAAVQEDRSDQRLQRIRDDRISPSAAGPLLPFSQKQILGQAELPRAERERG